MDSFLHSQTQDGTSDSEGVFTLSAADTRLKLLQSAPAGHPEAILLLLCDAMVKGGYEPLEHLKMSIFKQDYEYDVRKLTASLRYGTLNRPKDLYEALLHPFQNPQVEYTQFTRFAYWAAGRDLRVRVKWDGGSLRFVKTELTVHGELTDESEKVTIEVKLPNAFLSHASAVHHRKMASAGWKPFQLLPEEALTTPYSSLGYFSGRSKPFVLLKRLVPTSEPSALHFDLWKSSYAAIHPNLVLMDRKKPGNWLFRLWRPNYGHPCLLLESSETLVFGPQKCQAVFWIELSEQQASISFHKGDFFRDFTPINGPPGLRGYVIWPELKTDTWGWDFVKDDTFQQAVEWCEQQAASMSSTLKPHLDRVFQAAVDYRLVKSVSYYRDEVHKRMHSLWG